MKTVSLLIGLVAVLFSSAQTIEARLAAAMKTLEADEQFRHAIISMYVVDSKTGKPVFEKNAQAGLAPASCQKIVTSATAFEFLGKDYRYKTELLALGNLDNGILKGTLCLRGSGDPSLGSWRYKSSTEAALLERWMTALQQKNIRAIEGNIWLDDSRFSSQMIPGGWVWEDIGNYYGAGAGAINWRENQYDLLLNASDTVGGPVTIAGTVPENYPVNFINELITGKKGSGDNAYIYLPAGKAAGLISGTIPVGEKKFSISGSITDPAGFLLNVLADRLRMANIGFKKDATMAAQQLNGQPILLDTYLSPPLDSLDYWFLKKSINLYGEAFVKTIALQKTNYGNTDSGISIIRNFWKEKGIDPAALHIIDGSGLSPANRVTTNSLVSILQYARQQSWFPSFYAALPEMNGIKMKDGYIGGVRSYAGYVKSRTGAEYSFSFIVNNFEGSPGTVREKIWKLLDILK